MRKIAIVTATRAEYGLLKSLIQKVENDTELKLQLLVTGSHLLEEFGATYKEIESDFTITKKIAMDLSSDNALDISITMAKLQIKISKILNKICPDIVVILGDRYEMLSVATSAMMLNIPIAHIHGGETTEGAIDEAIRHAITKMSHLHFCATKLYRKRVIQLGEQASSVFNVGALGVENISKIELLSKNELEKSINFKFAKKNLLITYHPVTLEETSSKEQFKNLLDAINMLEGTHIIFTKANADRGGKIINLMIDEYVSKNRQTTVAYKSLGQLRYLSALKYMDAVVGNSSSGIIEAPSLKIATINIGDRQKGREKASSILDVKTNKISIFNAIKSIYSNAFKKTLQATKNPYQAKNTSFQIKEILKNSSLKDILKKRFLDL